MAALCADQPALHLTLRLTAAGAAATQVFWASDQQLTPACSLHSLPLQPDKPRLLADLVSAAAFRMLLALPVRILVPAAGLHYAEPPSFGGLRASQAGVQPNEPGLQPHLVSVLCCWLKSQVVVHACPEHAVALQGAGFARVLTLVLLTTPTFAGRLTRELA